MNDYFDKQNIQVLSTEKTFDFITDINVTEARVDETLRAVLNQHLKEISGYSIDEKRQQEINDKVFQNVHIPRTLQEISLEDLDKMQKRGEMDGLQTAVSRETRGIQGLQEALDEAEGEGEGEAEGEEESEGEGHRREKKKKFDPYEGMSKKDRKQKVKESNRERRKNKIPKYIKKKMTKKPARK